MADGAYLAAGLRRVRRRSGLTQAELAHRLGISPSYLNLIENGRRPLTPRLHARLAELPDDAWRSLLSTEERLRDELAEVFADPALRGHGVADAELSEALSVAPALGPALLRLYRAYRNAREDLRGRGDSLAGDPFLADSSHRLLTLLTSMRSYGEILRDNPDLGAVQGRCFLESLVEESERLTELVRRLFERLEQDSPGTPAAEESPAAAVARLLHARRNHFPELEAAAEGLRRRIGLGEADPAATLARALELRHRVRVVLADGEAPPDSGGERRLVLPEALPPSGRSFRMARRLALLAAGPALDAELGVAALRSGAARALYRRVLANYLAGALLMPYEPFRETAHRLRHDIERLQGRFCASFEQVCHRLTTLHRPGAQGVPFHFLRVDLAGNMSKCFSATGFRLPRHGGGCARWNAYGAFLDHGRIRVQVEATEDGARYLAIARAVQKPGAGHRAPRSHHSVSIGCDISFARDIVYADGLDLGDPGLAVPVGAGCRQCRRGDCAQRRAPGPLP